ncbi:MAG: YaiI/YqxD family protein [Lachnospiraceae bacterium]|nr:YaiI/YqxD family protein [Lachnospiraceae bacterium]
MQILIDADACPVIKITEKTAREYQIPVTLLCDTNHILQSDYSTVKTIDAGADAVDFALINLCKKGDIVVTQDYGVAAMALGKGAYAIHQSGRRYTDENMDRLLMERHLSKKARRASSKNHLKGPAKRKPKNDLTYGQSLRQLIEELKRG